MKLIDLSSSGERELGLNWTQEMQKSKREWVAVSTVIGVENRMVAEDRTARLESDVDEIKGDVKVLSARLNESIVLNAREFGSLRAEMEKGFGTLRMEIEKNRTETEKSLGSLRTSIESAKLWMLVTGVGSVILITFITFLGRVLKLF
jgi:hypothetical protein